MWWIHVNNMEKRTLLSNIYGIMFVKFGGNKDNNGSNNTYLNSQSKLNSKYLCDIEFDNTHRHRNYWSSGEQQKKQFKRYNFDHGKNGSPFAQKQPLYHLFKQLKIFDKQSEYMMSGNTSIIYTSCIEYLIIGLHYQILPIIVLLKKYFTSKIDFIDLLSNSLSFVGLFAVHCNQQPSTMRILEIEWWL